MKSRKLKFVSKIETVFYSSCSFCYTFYKIFIIESHSCCPLYSCTKELLGCRGELNADAHGCEICECAPGNEI